MSESSNRKWNGWLAAVVLSLAGCSSDGAGGPEQRNWACEISDPTTEASVPDYVLKMGCNADFLALASRPLDASIPGARSGKVVYDLRTQTLYFQNSNRYPIHYEFAKATQGATGEPLFTGDLNAFNPQYTLPEDRRLFLLAAVTYYEQPDTWALEIAPYDTSTPAMIEKLYRVVNEQAFYGPKLKFHPTSESLEKVAQDLAKDIPVVTNAELFASIRYQPLNVGEAVGTVKLMKAEQLATEYVSIKDIIVLDAVPNDISATAAIITGEFQTPLSHINVLARNRGTPNMGLRDATRNADILALVGKPARLTVSAFDWSIAPISQADADAWFEAHKPAPVQVEPPDTTVTDLRDIELVTEHTDEWPYVTFEQIKTATYQFGAKAANYSVFATDPLVPHKPAFAIPTYYYMQYMEENGVFAQLAEWQDAYPDFDSDDALRDAKLTELRETIRSGVFSDELTTALKEKLDQDFPGESMRFRSSTNAEDLDGFPCAGCYDSHTGDPRDPEFAGDQLAACLQAIRKTWATVWNKRTYDERMIHSIDHANVAMGLLVHTNFPDEEANGVAITANIFDATGNFPGFYVNVQYGGDYEVVHPPAGVTSDSFLHQYTLPDQPTIYYTTTNVPLPDGQEHVLSRRQIHDLGVALDRLHIRFANAYGSSDPGGWYAIDSEFKFDDFANPGEPAALYIKQARPYPASAALGSTD
jgi:pyruvate, water dikinase